MQTFPVHVDCVACKGTETIYVQPMDYIDWTTRGVHAQDAFPYLTADERESLITHMCLDCIEEMYADMEEEEEEDWLGVDDDMLYNVLDPESEDFTYESDWYMD